MPTNPDDIEAEAPEVIEPEVAAPVVAAVEPELEPVPPPAPDYDEAVMAKIKGWVFDHLSNSPVSRDGASWDTVQAALPALARIFS